MHSVVYSSYCIALYCYKVSSFMLRALVAQRSHTKCTTKSFDALLTCHPFQSLDFHVRYSYDL